MPRHSDDVSASVAPLRPTLKDVAARAGVSTAAVSQALNDRGTLRAETRQRILDVALQVFSERGYSEARVDEIAELSRTSKGGVYFHSGIGEKHACPLWYLIERGLPRNAAGDLGGACV